MNVMNGRPVWFAVPGCLPDQGEYGQEEQYGVPERPRSRAGAEVDVPDATVRVA